MASSAQAHVLAVQCWSLSAIGCVQQEAVPHTAELQILVCNWHERKKVSKAQECVQMESAAIIAMCLL